LRKILAQHSTTYIRSELMGYTGRISNMSVSLSGLSVCLTDIPEVPNSTKVTF